jgi:hypothetical protein
VRNEDGHQDLSLSVGSVDAHELALSILSPWRTCRDRRAATLANFESAKITAIAVEILVALKPHLACPWREA